MWNILRAVSATVYQPVSQLAYSRYPAVLSSFYHSLCRPTPFTAPSPLLAPQSVMTTQIAGMKVKFKVHRRCEDCVMYRQDERVFNYCKTVPKHKAKSKTKKHFNRWTMTHATQCKIRPY